MQGIALAGLMGSGKSTVGPLVAIARGMPFVDLDHRIAGRVGASVAVIFETEGEVGFRRHEREALEEILEEPPSVLALGGGTLHSPVSDGLRSGTNREILADYRVVWLALPWSVLEKRLRNSADRPLLAQANQLYETRRPELVRPDHLVAADGSPEEVAQAIAVALGPP